MLTASSTTLSVASRAIMIFLISLSPLPKRSPGLSHSQAKDKGASSSSFPISSLHIIFHLSLCYNFLKYRFRASLLLMYPHRLFCPCSRHLTGSILLWHPLPQFPSHQLYLLQLLLHLLQTSFGSL